MLPPPPTSLFYLNMANFLVEFALREGVTHITIVAGDLRSCNGSHSFHGVQRLAQAAAKRIPTAWGVRPDHEFGETQESQVHLSS